jgi:hypothetical protein
VPCKLWAQEINRMRNGEVTNERAIPPDPELIEKLKNAPTECPQCGGMLPRIVAGQTEVVCKYCGGMIRI